MLADLKQRLSRALRPEVVQPAPRSAPGKPVLESSGHCPTCDQDVTFVAHDPWLRDNFLCSNCGSLPRERALMAAIQAYFPDWPGMVIHESSPAPRGASARLANECQHYVPSQYFPDAQPGSRVEDVRCENLEAMTFEDESIGLHITQDVMEHVFHPSEVFREIARTLKPGGAHIFTVPLVRKHHPSVLRARIAPAGEIVHLKPPEYHGNPISDEGSLVTVDWGFDISRHIFEATGLFTHMLWMDDLARGIRADLIEVLVTLKPRSGGDGDAIP